MSDTIAAIATPMTPSAIGIIRLSGPGAIAAVDGVFTPAAGGAMVERPDRLLVYGLLRDEEGRTIDHCLATVSRAPHSYTGEDTAELQCHGSPAALILGLEALFAQGVRQAEAGEFTRRAFLAGKLDLTRTEAVADLIHAETADAVYQAAGQLGGAMAAVVEGVYHELAEVCAHFHAVLDYPDEDIHPFEIVELEGTLTRAARKLDQLEASYRRGRAVTQGIPCAVIGRPNVGKSTLFNALVGYERAIVTPIPGTTRDTVEERVNLGGILLRLIDTAGLREAEDTVERLGVQRSQEALKRAELAIVVLDRHMPVTPEDEEALALGMAARACIVVRNKADLPSLEETSVEEAVFSKLREKAPVVDLSALTGKGLELLEKAVASLFPDDSGLRPGAMLTNARQAEGARRSRQAVERGVQALAAGMPPDAVVADVEEAMSALGELTGRKVGEDVTALIFQRFCVWK